MGNAVQCSKACNGHHCAVPGCIAYPSYQFDGSKYCKVHAPRCQYVTGYRYEQQKPYMIPLCDHDDDDIDISYKMIPIKCNAPLQNGMCQKHTCHALDCCQPVASIDGIINEKKFIKSSCRDRSLGLYYYDTDGTLVFNTYSTKKFKQEVILNNAVNKFCSRHVRRTAGTEHKVQGASLSVISV